MDKFSGLARKLHALAGRGGNQVSERDPGQPGVGVSHPCLPDTLMSPDQATGKCFVIPLCQRARVLVDLIQMAVVYSVVLHVSVALQNITS